MSFFIYDVTFLIIFGLALIFFLYKKRKNLQREGLLYLYRTKIGIKLIDYIGKKYKRTLKVLSYFSVICGYILMVTMIFFLGWITWIYFNPNIVRAIKIPPFMPLIPYLPSLFKIDFLPPFYFTYWIISIAIIAVFHEFAHGIFAKYNGIKVKTTGFGFLGPFLAAFVEPDEKQMQKKGKFAQITVLSAGTFANTILAALFLILLSIFFMASYAPAGAMFNTYTLGIVNVSEINSIGGINISNPSSQSILDIIKNNEMKDDLEIGGNGHYLNLTKISIDSKDYFWPIEDLKNQLQNNKEYVIVYENAPALNAGLRGAIIDIDGNKIQTYKDLSRVMKNYGSGEKIDIKTKADGKILEYNITLSKDPKQEGRGVMGIGFIDTRGRISSKIADVLNFFREPGTYYEPRFSNDLVIFIYNLIWWIALVNISVALINMLPMGIFDGGRMFMLTVAAITKSDKAGAAAFKIATYVILGVIVLIIFNWFMAVF
jgi:membrane-associated protease RseP (regulator of RpoE activity)